MLQGFIERLLSWKSTAIALVTGLLTVLAAVKVIDSDVLTGGLQAFGEFYDVIVTLLGVIVTLLQLFKKEPEGETVAKKLFK